MRRVEFRLAADRLTNSEAPHPRRITAADRAQFATWIKTYRAAAWRTDNDDALLELGREIHAWLDHDHAWMTALHDNPGGPVIAEFATGPRPDAAEREFLEVPWELAASDDYLATDPTMMWAPLRRIGPRHAPLPLDHQHRLGVMFMAAAPRGQHRLNFEAEETEILRATAHTSLDLFVEDTGSLDELTAAWHQAKTLDALHLSCHGMGGDTPFLALEDEAGDLQRATLSDLAGAFVHRRPRLLFLSACHTGEGDREVDSLALGLVQAGFATVLGWADAVYDTDASAFAADFYRQAALPGMHVEEAWAAARFRLLLPRSAGRPRHWHLARLFLGSHGGGSLTDTAAPRVTTDIDAGRKAVIRARGGQIEVANRFEFVGRREQVQSILREFRHPTHAGVLIHGYGRQGKSSLAAHIMDRRPDLTPVVLFQRCDGPNLLAEIAERIPSAASLCAQYRPQVDPYQRETYDPDALFQVLRELLTGPCHSAQGGKPILLLLDDFEALLDPPEGGGHWQVKTPVEPPLSAIIRAFDAGDTDSRLLLTCRYTFPFADQRGRDLASRLLPVHLHAMPQGDALKQASQKQRAVDPRGRTSKADYDALAGRAIAAARGNTGLRDLLFQAALADRPTGEAAITAVEQHFTAGVQPENETLRTTLETLAIEQLVAPLLDGELRLLRAATLFNLPLPLSVWRRFATASALGAPDRLLAFGLWERVPDIADPHTDAATINAIVAAHLDENRDAHPQQIVGAILADLFTAWGGNDQSKTPYAADIELTRLALLCGNLDVLAATAEHAIRGHEQAFDYRAAAATAAATLDALSASDRLTDAALLRAAAEVFDRVGNPDALRRVYALAPSLGDDPSLPPAERIARAQFRGRYGGYLRRQGEPDQAQHELQSASSVFEALGDRRSSVHPPEWKLCAERCLASASGSPP